MKTRFIITLVLWAVLLLFLYVLRDFGGFLLLLLVSGLSQWELYGMLEAQGQRPLKTLGVVLGTILIFGSYYIPMSNGIDSFVFVVLILSITILYRPDFKNEYLPTLFGLVYIPFMLQFYGLVLRDYHSLFLPIWLIAVAKFSDVGGLLIGKQFGKNKLAPHISPGKTIEGAAGGILTSVIVGIVLIAIFTEGSHAGFGLLKGGFIAACIGTIAIISDLIESVIKRQANVKDSGNIIPGIGGVFDLTDSLILTAPVGYLLIKYLTG